MMARNPALEARIAFAAPRAYLQGRRGLLSDFSCHRLHYNWEFTFCRRYIPSGAVGRRLLKVRYHTLSDNSHSRYTGFLLAILCVSVSGLMLSIRTLAIASQLSMDHGMLLSTAELNRVRWRRCMHDVELIVDIDTLEFVQLDDANTPQGSPRRPAVQMSTVGVYAKTGVSPMPAVMYLLVRVLDMRSCTSLYWVAGFIRGKSMMVRRPGLLIVFVC
ncbi:uncharacterized protein C8Q71DRAFT_790481 [Rhodofomes roseus]|uniref:Uncharacterized protein n=1 Tax=Rhodofomes roseus TaxID=34475 RepID=A0ABQ8JZ06_9APHY|nr:uncharacterized protein C8Q71DRAFT_790481 [Rhodofomes roseus]KAH9829488.1 hypothetical protein C8Q71DRAFT_790481 [Rhodofomes roseus]